MSASLSKYEIACLTAGVPVSGDPVLDGIIRQGLRFKTACEILSAFNREWPPLQGEALTDSIGASIQAADALIERFSK